MFVLAKSAHSGMYVCTVEIWIYSAGEFPCICSYTTHTVLTV
jgi:hypothetical protein